MFRLALRNLVHEKAQLILSVGGVALALSLVLIFDAIFAGVTGRLTLYIDKSGADVWVSQQGVQTLHMSASAMPASVVDEVRAVEGVEDATPLLYTTDMVFAHGDQYVAYIMGIPSDATLGTPWQIVAGAQMPGPGEVVLDRSIARSAGLEVGDSVLVLGREMRVGGLTAGTASLVNSVAFIRFEDFAQIRGSDVVSFVLVKAAGGQSAESLRERIAADVPNVTVQTRSQFAREERQFTSDMSTDVINIMTLSGVAIGLAVLSLTVYLATMSRQREYGVMKALGVRNRALYRAVVWQALISVAFGLTVAIAISLVISAVVSSSSETFVLSVTPMSVARLGLIAVGLAVLAAVVPARRVARLEPATVFRKGNV